MTPQICTNIRIESNTPDHNPSNSYFQNKIVKKKIYCLAHLKLAAAFKSVIEAPTTREDGFEEA